MPDTKKTITEVAEEIGVVPKTIMRWEKTGKVPKPKRDFRGWRVYTDKDLEELKGFIDALY